MSVTSLYTGSLIEAARDTTFQDCSQLELRDDAHRAEGVNPVCGDRVQWFFIVEGGIIEAICYQAKGCLMSRASASFLARFVRGRTLEEARALKKQVIRLTEPNTPEPDPQRLRKHPWTALAQISDFPARRKCVTLAWESFFRALEEIQP